VSGPLVDADWIAAHLDDPAVRLIEVDVSPAAYAAGHIPGAVLWNAYGDLRHPDLTLIEDAELAELLERSGVGNDTTVVFYGYGAQLGHWLLASRDHGDVRFMDGPRDQWNGEWVEAVPSPARGTYELRPSNGHYAPRDEVERGNVLVLDVRSQAEYDGERFWPSGAPEEVGRAGHVPGAVHIPIESFATDEIRNVLADAGVTPDARVVTYCTIGNRASAAWFALHGLGYSDAAVYYGSWAEWGMQPDSPVAR
jgi:thiosulfate/3-mercaptopyruvate sulfurtransferase